MREGGGMQESQDERTRGHGGLLVGMISFSILLLLLVALLGTYV
jgi:hypothetical protein